MLIDKIAERIEKDKLLHFIISMIAMRLLLAVVSKSFFFCFLTAILVLSVGFLKNYMTKNEVKSLIKRVNSRFVGRSFWSLDLHN